MNFHNELTQILQSIDTHSQPLLNYGSIALFFLLALGIIALPIPDETLLITAGFLINQAKLPLGFTFLAAYAGAICGISLSYVIEPLWRQYIIKKIWTLDTFNSAAG